jgi:oligopeptide transport system substrate-binding protein
VRIKNLFNNRVLLISIVALFGLVLLGFFWPYPSNSSIDRPNPDNQRVFRMNLGTEPPSLDSVLVRDLVSITVINAMMRGLLVLDPKSNQLKPACATSWTISPDERTYTFYLNPKARWSDGKPVLAQDFTYSIRRGLDPKNAAPYAFFLFYLKNGKAYYDGTLKDITKVGIRTPNKTTVVFELEAPLAFFPSLLAFPTYYPQRQDVVEKYGDSWTEAGHAVSNGPYQLASWKHDDSITLIPNPHYAGPKAHFSRIVMMMITEPNTSLIMYENNELDFVETSSSLPSKEVRRIKARPEYQRMTLHGINYIGFNAFPKVFQSGETPIMSWITPGLIGYNPKLGIPFNPAHAKALLAKAGYPEGKGFPKIEFWVPATSPESVQMAEIAQAQWKKYLNIDITLRRTEWKVFLKQLDNDPPALFRLQWFVDYPDADSFMTVFISGSGNGNIRWQNAHYDTWVQNAGRLRNPKQRQALYDKAQQLLLVNDAAIIPLFVIPKNSLMRPGLTGVSMSPLNILSID